MQEWVKKVFSHIRHLEVFHLCSGCTYRLKLLLFGKRSQPEWNILVCLSKNSEVLAAPCRTFMITCVCSVCYLMGCTLLARRKSFNQFQLFPRFVLTFGCCVNFICLYVITRYSNPSLLSLKDKFTNLEQI